MPLSTIFANKVGRYRFAMACKKSSTTTSTRTGRYGFMNRSNLIIFLYFHSNYRYIGICQGINPRSTYSCLLRRRAMEREGCWVPFTLSPRQRSPDPVRGASPPAPPLDKPIIGSDTVFMGNYSGLPAAGIKKSRREETSIVTMKIEISTQKRYLHV